MSMCQRVSPVSRATLCSSQSNEGSVTWSRDSDETVREMQSKELNEETSDARCIIPAVYMISYAIHRVSNWKYLAKKDGG